MPHIAGSLRGPDEARVHDVDLVSNATSAAQRWLYSCRSKRLLLGCVSEVFTISSLLCGFEGNLPMLLISHLRARVAATATSEAGLPG